LEGFDGSLIESLLEEQKQPSNGVFEHHLQRHYLLIDDWQARRKAKHSLSAFAIISRNVA
jgi:hypothetical protein